LFKARIPFIKFAREGKGGGSPRGKGGGNSGSRGRGRKGKTGKGKVGEPKRRPLSAEERLAQFLFEVGNFEGHLYRITEDNPGLGTNEIYDRAFALFSGSSHSRNESHRQALEHIETNQRAFLARVNARKMKIRTAKRGFSKLLYENEIKFASGPAFDAAFSLHRMLIIDLKEKKVRRSDKFIRTEIIKKCRGKGVDFRRDKKDVEEINKLFFPDGHLNSAYEKLRIETRKEGERRRN
jgi:hypothetical protein